MFPAFKDLSKRKEVLLRINPVHFCGLYYKHMTIVNYASGILNKLEALLTDDARVVIYDHHVFIVWPPDLKFKTQ